MDEWKRLCSHAYTEGRVVSRLAETGLSAVMKDAVLKEIIKPAVGMAGLEKTVNDTVNNSSKYAL